MTGVQTCALPIYPLLAFQVHRVEHLRGHEPGVDGVGRLKQSIGERRLAVIDVRDDAEVAELRLWDLTHAVKDRTPLLGSADGSL